MSGNTISRRSSLQCMTNGPTPTDQRMKMSPASPRRIHHSALTVPACVARVSCAMIVFPLIGFFLTMKLEPHKPA